jgi:hypothetical protein
MFSAVTHQTVPPHSTWYELLLRPSLTTHPLYQPFEAPDGVAYTVWPVVNDCASADEAAKTELTDASAQLTNFTAAPLRHRSVAATRDGCKPHVAAPERQSLPASGKRPQRIANGHST